MKKFDLTVIGAGPAGYVAAIRAAQLGLSVALVEKREKLGGTCLNIGCIPSKALLDSSELFQRCNKGLVTHGIEFSKVKLNLEKMMERKRQVVDRLTSGLSVLMKGRKVETFHGTGSAISAIRN